MAPTLYLPFRGNFHRGNFPEEMADNPPFSSPSKIVQAEQGGFPAARFCLGDDPGA
jgi:hypothetical protein